MRNSNSSQAHHAGARSTGCTNYVRCDAFRDSFPRVVRELGGDPDRLLESHGLTNDALQRTDGTVNYRKMIELFEQASVQLACQDFGLRLARCTAEGVTVLGPLEIAMRNACSLRQALEFCGRHVHVFSSAVHVSIERDERGHDYLQWDLLLDGIVCDRQVVEHALGLTFNAVRALSGGKVGPSEIWFTHGRKAPVECYREYFGVPVRFGMPYNALYFAPGDIDRPIADRHPQIYDMAVSYIHQNFPLTAVLLTQQVRVILGRLLAMNRCHQTVVAEMMAMHPRTFQRRLREEGTTFEAIVDLVRREIALRNLADDAVPLMQIAEKLGYSETSVLTRSCHRWFDRSPRQVRKEAGQGGSELASRLHASSPRSIARSSVQFA